MGCCQESKNVLWLTFYFRHTMVDHNEAATVVTHSKAHFCPDSYISLTVGAPHSEKWKGIFCNILSCVHAHAGIANRSHASVGLAWCHNTLLHSAPGNHSQLIRVSLWDEPTYPRDGKETELGRLTGAQTLLAVSNAKLLFSITWETSTSTSANGSY